ncbi:hypothetical protein [Nocardioides terrigena]|uniref:hypothetical protein n=1 Tax=Nocardioides terrigena TaxID=424797 RepID=UPI000D30E33E|nr:hypothetical protein [Nocardioides terrigena]
MSAEILRRAAARARLMGTAPASLGADYNDPRHIAVADLLEHEARVVGTRDAADISPLELAVARAYLGESA